MPRDQASGEFRLHPETIPASPPLTSSAPASPLAPHLLLERGLRIRSAAYAAAIGILLSFLPFGGPLFGLPIAGWLAVRFYTRSSRSGLRPSAGFRLGAIAGLLVFAVFLAFGALTVALSSRAEVQQALSDVANRTHSFNPDVQPQQFVTFVMTPEGAMTLVFMFCIMSVVLSGLGGLVSAAVSQRRPNP